MIHHRLLKSFGPILLSALSIFVSFQIIQPFATTLDPSFSLFANKGIGKIGITVLVILHIFLLLLTCSQKLWHNFITTNFSFFSSRTWLKPFLLYFITFAALHAIFLNSFLFTNAATINPQWTNCFRDPSFFYKFLPSIIAPFFVAWTEELIFRGTVFPILAQNLTPLPSAIATSLIFMAAHDLSNPLNLFTTKWKLGLGLFLLGLFLNLIFIATKKLYTGMGAHAGLVFVKVLLRRIPLLTYGPLSMMPWWLDIDLRQAPLFHAAFFIACLIMIWIIHRSSRSTLDI